MHGGPACESCGRPHSGVQLSQLDRGGGQGGPSCSSGSGDTRPATPGLSRATGRLLLSQDIASDEEAGSDNELETGPTLEDVREELAREAASTQLGVDQGPAPADHAGHFVEPPPVDYIATMGAWTRGFGVSVKTSNLNF